VLRIKAIFLRPSNPTGSAYLTKFGFLPVPLGILQLAADVRDAGGWHVSVIDMEADSISEGEVIEQIVKQGPDLLGITLHATAAHSTSGRIATAVKKALPDVVTVAGGHHATFLPHEMLKAGFDLVAIGEGDGTIRDIAIEMEGKRNFSRIPGLAYMDGGRCIRTEPRELITNLDSLPLPAFELVDSARYTFGVFGKDNRVACIETSRGCPYACDFCSVTPTWGNKWRNKSVGRTIAEMELAEKYGYNWIFFTDDIFVVPPTVEMRRNLFKRIMERGFRFRWIAQMRADITSKNPDLIKKAAEAGLTVAFLGVESGSQEVLKKMHKGIFTPQSLKAVQVLSSNGVVVLVGMMLGAPYETFKDMLMSIKFSNKLADAGADALQFSIYTPLPGTRIFYDALTQGKLFTLDWDRYDILTPVSRGKVHPSIVQLMQFYGTYSFYVRKFFKNMLVRKKPVGAKRDLMLNATRYTFDMMPVYIRDMAKFPAHFLETARKYREASRLKISNEDVKELVQYTGNIIYKQIEGFSNPYFIIGEDGKRRAGH
jgi:anaerobic magnesium-protoporphyrin IX monomethyl ester cyclase